MKDGFSPLIIDITETDVTGQQPITIEKERVQEQLVAPPFGLF